MDTAHFDRRPARADGRARRFRPSRHGRQPARVPRARAHRARRRLRAVHAGRHARAALSHPLERAAEALRAEAPARLRVLDAGPRPLPRQRLLPARSRRRSVPSHSAGDQVARGARPPARSCTASRRTRAGSCSSPARPARASRRRSPRSSTRSTARAPSTSSRSRTRSSSCTAHKKCIVNQREIGPRRDELRRTR